MGNQKTLRISIVGCGKIADQHVAAIDRLPDCEIVSLCDREILMAQQLGERIGVSDCFAEADELIRETNPDVVHITTPPFGHFPLAKLCLESGCNVYLEKPFTINAPEARELIQMAENRDLRITAGHNLQFTEEMLEMRKLIASDYLGGSPVHIESHFSYDLGHTTYVGPLLGNPNHWVRKLPGRLLHNIISHPVAKMAEFLDDEIDEVIATATQSATLKNCGVEGVLDELRVMIRDAKGCTAYFCFSTSFKPGANQLKLYGPSNSLLINNSNGHIIPLENKSNKSYLVYIIPPFNKALQYGKAACRNLYHILRGRLYQDFGMKELIGQFYESIQSNSEPPIPYREIELTARIMDSIFKQIYKPDHSNNLNPMQPIEK